MDQKNKYRLTVEYSEIIYRSKIIDVRAESEEEARDLYRMEGDLSGVIIGNNEMERITGPTQYITEVVKM